jgi:hypothetical protein
MSRRFWIVLTMVLAAVMVACTIAALVVWNAPGEQKATTAAVLAGFAGAMTLIAAGVSR